MRVTCAWAHLLGAMVVNLKNADKVGRVHVISQHCRLRGVHIRPGDVHDGHLNEWSRGHVTRRCGTMRVRQSGATEPSSVPPARP